jgi:SWI/SNF-related matrix-associated actin-dependent regulator 1 of chromatin subfamily A
LLTPRPYQFEGRDFLAGRSRALLADEMRVGKTPQAILAAHARGARSVLVLCPAIAEQHWLKEWRKWSQAGYFPRIDVLSYDKARSFWCDDRLSQCEWDLMIVDEAHFCKNPTAQRTQMVYGKGGLGYQVGAIWALSGTPAPKHAAELWPMLRAFGVVGMTYDEFCWRYCWMREDGRIGGTRVDRIPELKALLAKCMLRRTRKQVAPDMPEIGFEFLEFEPTATADLAAPAGLSDEQLLTWLEDHPFADTENRQMVALAKAGALVEEVSFAIENELLRQTVVFGWHVEPLRELARKLNETGITVGVITGATSQTQREIVQAAFREGKVQVVCANILAAGTAIDLSAASHGYFLELDWVPGVNVQAANRLVSMDKKEPVTFDVCTWPGSIDDRVQRVLMRRVKEINQLI